MLARFRVAGDHVRWMAGHPPGWRQRSTFVLLRGRERPWIVERSDRTLKLGLGPIHAEAGARLPGESAFDVGPEALEGGEGGAAVIPDRLAEVLVVELGRYATEGDRAALKDLVGTVPLAEPSPPADLGRDPVHRAVQVVQAEAEEDDLGMSQGPIQADRVGEAGPLVIIEDRDDMDALGVDVLLDSR